MTFARDFLRPEQFFRALSLTTSVPWSKFSRQEIRIPGAHVMGKLVQALLTSFIFDVRVVRRASNRRICALLNHASHNMEPIVHPSDLHWHPLPFPFHPSTAPSDEAGFGDSRLATLAIRSTSPHGTNSQQDWFMILGVHAPQV